MIYKKTKAKSILHNKNEINVNVLKAMEIMSNVVGATLGPGGRPVLIERDNLPPLISKDGMTVASTLGVFDANVNVILETAKEICLNTARSAGDGTTTAILLAYSLVKHGQEFIFKDAKYNPQRFMSEIDEAYKTVCVPYIKKASRSVKKDKQLYSVAKISANGDEELAKAAVDAMLGAGDDGHIMIIEDQGGTSIKVETIDGYIIITGLKDLRQLGPIFINDKGGQQVKMDNGIVFLYDGSVNDLQVPGFIQSALEARQDMTGVPILVIAHDFSDLVIEAFAKQVKKGWTVVPVITPKTAIANSKSLFLQDMAAYTGGKIYDPGIKEQISVDGAGHFTEAKVGYYETFIRACPKQEDIDKRVGELKAIMENAPEYHRLFLRAEISKLIGGLSTIYIGGVSDVEIREKKARAEDAVEALRSAIDEGIIPGGCIIQLIMADILRNHPDKKKSWEVLATSLEYPFYRLLENCGENPSKVFSEDLSEGIKNRDCKKIYDAAQHKIVDPYKAGILEPAKVCRVALDNAISVAKLLITLGGLIIVPRDANLEMQREIQSDMFNQVMDAAKEENE